MVGESTGGAALFCVLFAVTITCAAAVMGGAAGKPSIPGVIGRVATAGVVTGIDDMLEVAVAVFVTMEVEDFGGGADIVLGGTILLSKGCGTGALTLSGRLATATMAEARSLCRVETGVSACKRFAPAAYQTGLSLFLSSSPTQYNFEETGTVKAAADKQERRCILTKFFCR